MLKQHLHCLLGKLGGAYCNGALPVRSHEAPQSRDGFFQVFLDTGEISIPLLPPPPLPHMLFALVWPVSLAHGACTANTPDTGLPNKLYTRPEASLKQQGKLIRQQLKQRTHSEGKRNAQRRSAVKHCN